MMDKIKRFLKGPNYFAVVRDLLNVCFVLIAIYLAIPGIESFMQMYREISSPDLRGPVMFWVVFSWFSTITFLIFTRNFSRTLSDLIAITLLLTLVLSFGFLGNGGEYVYFLGLYVVLWLLIFVGEKYYIHKGLKKGGA